MQWEYGLNAAETGHLAKDFRTGCELGSGWHSRACICLCFQWRRLVVLKAPVYTKIT